MDAEQAMTPEQVHQLKAHLLSSLQTVEGIDKMSAKHLVLGFVHALATVTACYPGVKFSDTKDWVVSNFLFAADQFKESMEAKEVLDDTPENHN